jgi:hypothetical protein
MNWFDIGMFAVLGTVALVIAGMALGVLYLLGRVLFFFVFRYEGKMERKYAELLGVLEVASKMPLSEAVVLLKAHGITYVLSENYRFTHHFKVPKLFWHYETNGSCISLKARTLLTVVNWVFTNTGCNHEDVLREMVVAVSRQLRRSNPGQAVNIFCELAALLRTNPQFEKFSKVVLHIDTYKLYNG